MKRLANALPYFDYVQSVVATATASHGHGHGHMVLIVRDPSAGLRRRYSVLKINCQTGRTTCHGRELPLQLSRFIQRKIVSKLVERGEKDPVRITGWCDRKHFPVDIKVKRESNEKK